MLKAIAALLALACTATASPTSRHVLHEKRDAHPSRWIKRDRVLSESILPVRVGLMQSNLDNAHGFLMDVSDPASPNFGKHWTSEEVIEKFKPSDESISTVRAWLEDAGFSNVVLSDNKAWLAFDAEACDVEELLQTEYHEYEDSRSGAVVPSTDRYHVPAHVTAHIDYITPGLKLLAPDHLAPSNKQRRDLAKRNPPPLPQLLNVNPIIGDLESLWNCDNVITPQCIAALYKIPPAGPFPNPANKMGVYESSLQFWDQEDLNLFFANASQNIPQGTHPETYSIDGGVSKTTNVSDAGGEIMLDLELIYPIVYPQSVVIWDENDLNYQSNVNDTSTFGFNQMLDAMDGSYCTYSAYGETGDDPDLDPHYPDYTTPGGYPHPLQCGVFKPTTVISTSYGGQEIDVPIAYQKRQCNEFLKLGLQGVSFLFASGDTGVQQYPESLGGLDGPTGCLGPKENVFNPTWPLTCPYITGVGATKVYPPNNVFESQPESAVYDPAGDPYEFFFASGGGFSNIYPVPDYQKDAVATYFDIQDPAYQYYSALSPNVPNPAHVDIAALQGGNTNAIYNRIGRGYPDVSAVGDNILTFTNGVGGLSGGTSASTPIFSSIINRINEERLAVGKSSVGFLNPTLYSHSYILDDVTNGTNPGCGTIGFKTAKGWDPVSGLGTPNFPAMLALYLSLP